MEVRCCLRSEKSSSTLHDVINIATLGNLIERQIALLVRISAEYAADHQQRLVALLGSNGGSALRLFS
ncbi:hypothetical protein O9992_06365 [Vibrio lentus]|nr:hypothetical protein [Vibrio lentus]